MFTYPLGPVIGHMTRARLATNRSKRWQTFWALVDLMDKVTAGGHIYVVRGRARAGVQRAKLPRSGPRKSYDSGDRSCLGERIVRA